MNVRVQPTIAYVDKKEKRQVQSSEQSQGTRNKTCLRCGNKGHFARDCRSRKGVNAVVAKESDEEQSKDSESGGVFREHRLFPEPIDRFEG